MKIEIEKMKFPLGQTVMTPGVANTFADDREQLQAIMQRHVYGDWGDVCADDSLANESALANGQRILSVYHLMPAKAEGNRPLKLYIITEWNRETTTILFPSEY